MEIDKLGYKKTELGWIPKEWEVCYLKECAQILLSNVDKKRKNHEILVRLCNYTDVYKHLTITNNLQFMTATASKSEIEKFSIRKGDVIITKDSETADDIAISTLVTEEFDNVLCGYHLALIRSNRTLLLGEYLSNLFQCYTYRHYFSNFANGITRFGLSIRIIQNTPIPLPPLPEQKKIAEILTTVDEKIQFIEEQIEQTELLKKGLMQKLLTQGIGHTEFKNTSIGRLPKEWEVVKAQGLFINCSKKKHPNEKLLSVTQDRGVLPRDLLDTRVVMPTINLNTFKLVEPGDFVISLRSFQGGIEYSEYKGIVSPAYTILKKKKEIDSYFYKFLFKKESFISKLSVAVVGIRDGKQINYKDFSEIYLPLPPLPEQQKIAEILTTVDEKLEILHDKKEQYSHLKKGLMQQLLTGKIRV